MPIEQHVQDSILNLHRSGTSINEIARRLKLSSSTVHKYVSRDPDSYSSQVGGDTTIIEEVRNHPIRTEKQAIEAFEIDIEKWRIVKMDCTAWTVAIKLKHGEADQVRQEQQYRIRITLQLRRPQLINDVNEAILERIKKHAPRYSEPPKYKPSKEKHLAVFGLFDVHFGKLAWELETGSNYDLKIADTIYRNAVQDMMHYVGHITIDKIVLPIGNDFFHIDNLKYTTTAGTPQDTDGRLAKIVETGEMAVIWAVEQLRLIAPVDVLWVPGNHDTQISYHLARTIWAWFNKAKNVSVDYSPSHRKYVDYGKNLLGFTHGNEEKHEELPMLMANERPAEHARTTCREWLIGHRHQQKAVMTKPIVTHSGTVVRTLSSLAGTDSWHYRKGYINLNRSAEVHVYGHDSGRCGQWDVKARS